MATACICGHCVLDSTYIHDKHFVLLPPILLCFWLDEPCRTESFSSRHRMGDMWVNYHKAHGSCIGQPTCSAFLPKILSTRGLGCFYIIHHIHSSPDVVISKGNLLWVIMLETDIKYASRITCIICCGCGLTMQREQVQKERKKWFWWGLIASLDQTLNLSCTQ